MDSLSPWLELLNSRRIIYLGKVDYLQVVMGFKKINYR